ncbi:MAG TPA: DNA-binding protein [Bryobacteraceae bacterium]
MAEKKPFALRMDAAMMKAIEKWAADEFRSVNGQIEWILHRALKEAGRWKEHPPGEDGEGGDSKKKKE